MEEQMKYLEKIEELNKKLTSAQEEIEKLNEENEKLNAENETLSNAKPVIELNKKLSAENKLLKEQSEKDKKDCEEKLNKLNKREEVLAGKESQYQADRNNLDGVIRKRTNEGINKYIEENKAYVAEKKGIIERNVKEAEIDREKAVEELAQARKEGDKIRADRQKELIPFSIRGIVLIVLLFAAIAYSMYWCHKINKANNNSETVIYYRWATKKEEQFGGKRQIPEYSKYIKALIEAKYNGTRMSEEAWRALCLDSKNFKPETPQEPPKTQKKQRRR